MEMREKEGVSFFFFFFGRFEKEFLTLEFAIRNFEKWLQVFNKNLGRIESGEGSQLIKKRLTRLRCYVYLKKHCRPQETLPPWIKGGGFLPRGDLFSTLSRRV